MAITPEIDDQATGEAINPVANAIKATIIAIVLVTASIAAFLHFSKPAPMFSGNVVRISAAPMPIQRQTDEGADLPVTIPDQMLVFGQIHIQNLTDKTLTIQEINGDLLENNTTVTDSKDPNVSTTTTRRSVAASGRSASPARADRDPAALDGHHFAGVGPGRSLAAQPAVHRSFQRDDEAKAARRRQVAGREGQGASRGCGRLPPLALVQVVGGLHERRQQVRPAEQQPVRVERVRTQRTRQEAGMSDAVNARSGRLGLLDNATS